MAVSVSDLRYGESTKTLQDIILLILAKEYPLTMGEIAKRVKKDFKTNVTFQAVRKSLLALIGRKIISEQLKEFSVNREYILEHKQLTDQLLRNYYTSEQKERLPATATTGEDHTVYMFDTLLQADRFWGEIVFDWAHNLKDSDDHQYFFQGPHMWYPFGHVGVEMDFLSELKSHGVQVLNLIENNTVLDQWVKHFYLAYGAKYAIKPKPESHATAIGVFGDNILQFDYPLEIMRDLDRFFSTTTDLAKLNLTRVAAIVKKKAQIKLTLMRNKVIAENLKKEIGAYF
jgi:hypothetical protein